MKTWLAGVALLACAAPAFASRVHDCDAPAEYRVLSVAEAGPTDARAYWLDADTLQWPGAPAHGVVRLGDVVLERDTIPLDAGVAERFKFIGDGPRYRLPDGVDAGALLRSGAWLSRVVDGRVADVTQAQQPGALDALYATAAEKVTLGYADGRVTVWAPTATNVQVCEYASPDSMESGVVDATRDDASGTWTAPLAAGRYYLWLLDVPVPGIGLVRQRVSDPYSVALAANGARSFAISLDDPRLAVPGFDKTPDRIATTTDLSIYELHVRDFSRDDATVPVEHRGKYLGFTHPDSKGMRHLRALATAGLTDVHLLPVFDFATVDERHCDPNGDAKHDCFNWGYEPVHFNAPEGSYATDPDGIARIVEFRRMVKALHDANLRVGMDVVYNHTTAAGQAPQSVLDRIVPGYYQRLNAKGEVETSTCCANTATEHRMMARLMRDSVVLWATQFGIDSFRFDLMGHQPRAAMESLKGALWEAKGRDVPLIGEGWNFGEVADGKRFVQASQLSLEGAGIGTFSDRARDAVRGGGPSDKLPALRDAKGWVNGTNDAHLADLVRVGLGGTLKDPWAKVDYNGQPAGYAAQPGEVVNYVENHDNLTLFDLNVYKLPADTTSDERARVQLLAAATTAFSQGIAYWHAGLDVLRSKSLEGNSYDAGDPFNRLDWTYTDNGFSGEGAEKIKPRPQDIAWMRDAFRDLLRIRASTPLFRMRDAGDIRKRLVFPVTGDARVIAGRIDGRAFPDANFGGVLYLLNADTQARGVELSKERNAAWTLHPVHRDGTDARARDATFDAKTGRFTIPPRTAVVFVLPPSPEALPPLQTSMIPAGLAGSDEIRVDIQLPPHYDAKHATGYPVLYLNDGQDLADVHVRDALQAGYEDGSLRPLILVAIHMPKDRMGAYGVSDRAAGRSIIGPTKYGPVGTHAHAYSEWVAHTLVPWVDARWRTVANASGRSILGWSLGGLNAFNLGFEYPEVFGRVGAFSPSFWIAANEQDVENTRLAVQKVREGAPPPGLKVFLGIGTAEETDDRDGDGTIDVLDDARDLAAAAQKRGASVDPDYTNRPGRADVAVYTLEGGIHRQPSWAKMLPVFLRWAYAVHPPALNATGTIESWQDFPSRYVPARNVDIRLPVDYASNPGKRYPVVYMHDGQNLFDPGQSRVSGVDWGIDETLARLVAAGEVRDAIVVGVWCTVRRLQEYMPRRPVESAGALRIGHGIPDIAVADIDSDDYLRFLVEELKPFIDANYRTLPGRDDTVVMGSSMGGLVSLYAASKYPDVFGGVGAVSTHWPAADGIALDDAIAHLPDRATHRLYFDYGTATLDAGYAPFQARMDDALRAAGWVEGDNWMTRRFEGAEHSERAWNARAEVPLKFLLGK